MEKSRYPGLEIDEHMPLQRREWRIQRVAWFFLYTLLGAIVLGLLGNGPLSHVDDVTSDGALRVEYERFMRHRSPDTLRFSLKPDGDQARLSFDGHYLRRLEITKIVPEPEATVPGTDEMTFIFRVQAATPMQVAIHLQPEHAGNLTGWAALDGRQPLTLRHFVYP